MKSDVLAILLEDYSSLLEMSYGLRGGAAENQIFFKKSIKIK